MIAAALGLVVALAQPPDEAVYRRFSWPVVDGMSTRDRLFHDRCQVLEADRRGRPRFVRCVDQYTGELYEGPTSGLDVEHVIGWVNVFFRVPAERWSQLRDVFADPRNLILTGRSLNRSKGGKTLDEFCPPEPRARQWLARRVGEYAGAWGIDLGERDTRGRRAWLRGECAQPP